MINFLKLIAHHFRLWFLPQPAHDDFVASKEEMKSAPDPEPEPAPAPAADEQPSQKLVLSDSPDDRPDFSHLVKEPEAADQRLGRASYSRYAKSDEPESESESESEELPPTDDIKTNDQD